MTMDSPGLLSPSAADLPLLFEITRLLGRYPDLSEAFEPLIRSIEEATELRDGAVAIVVDGRDHHVLIASGLPYAQAGRRVVMGEGPLGVALEAGQLVEGRDETGPWLALPAGVGASLEFLLAFRVVGPTLG
ncbi:MAG TPA: hypothetical protein VMV44_01425, partial [Rectinemataceae bacterium]|nr:hypothetical protein [Rectinemataceae bacterium]